MNGFIPVDKFCIYMVNTWLCFVYNSGWFIGLFRTWQQPRLHYVSIYCCIQLPFGEL